MFLFSSFWITSLLLARWKRSSTKSIGNEARFIEALEFEYLLGFLTKDCCSTSSMNSKLRSLKLVPSPPIDVGILLESRFSASSMMTKLLEFDRDTGATPKSVLELMDVKDLTLSHVKSHLQGDGILADSGTEQLEFITLIHHEYHKIHGNGRESHRQVHEGESRGCDWWSYPRPHWTDGSSLDRPKKRGGWVGR
ncbi:Homeodomain-like protein [Cynara cardunculus var. scolymus]|uniref:Homeodomain-like protein n=1 Tax=Cynara cardunculus var. scolymus TaxID=59895 RepID=A0A103Y8E1_CYNCS|nr:Homeodomain-like protein [Cynara cardunculus var. scolymus]